MADEIEKSENNNDSTEDILINPNPKGLSDEEVAKLLGMDIREEFYIIAQELEKFHGIFAQLWEMGLPRLTLDLPTAAVSFDKKGRNIEFLFNPIFWRDTDLYTKCFIICHEVLHVMLNHGIRTRDCPMPQIANKALDVVVNHTLTSKFGFDRASIDVGTYPDEENIPEDLRGKPVELCWIDTVFVGFHDKVERNKSFEYYYNILEKNMKFSKGKCMVRKPQKKGQGQGQGQGGEGEYQEVTGSVLDDHNQLSGFDNDRTQDDIAEEIEDRLNPDEMEDLMGKIGDCEEGDEAKKAEAKSDDDGNGEGNKTSDSDSKNRGTIAGRLLYKANVHQKVRTKRKWEQVIKQWSRKYKDDPRDVEQWARRRRRYSALDESLMLPNDMEEEGKSETMIDVWFFQDTSGSCYGFRDRFFAAARSLPKDKFRVHLFCFDTQVYKASLEEGKLYGFGGTSFDILERYVQQELSSGSIKKYPDAIFVITDGYGNNIRPAMPKKWYFFLSEDYTQCIPDECHIFKLEDYE